MLEKLKRYKYPYLFIMPFFVLFLVFQLIPAIWTIFISFTAWNGIGKPEPVGFDNYIRMFRDPMFKEAFSNTVVYWVTGFSTILVLSICIALLLTQKDLLGKSFFKTVAFLPNVCAAIAMGLIFRMLFDENVGLVNELISLLGGEKLPWLTSTSMSKIPVIVLNVWRNTPWFTMIIISGLLGISPDLYEAAEIDGAGPFRKFLQITLPSLGNILFFCFVTLTVDSWKIFNEPFILPGPGVSNTSLFQYMYQSGFTIFKMGYASAIGCVLILILLVISLVQFSVRKRQGEL